MVSSEQIVKGVRKGKKKEADVATSRKGERKQKER